MNRQLRVHPKFSQKVTNLSMLNLKTIRNINPMIILCSMRNFYTSSTALHHQIKNSPLLT